MKVDGAALVLNRKRANNIKFVSFFSELGRDIWQFLYANQLLCRESLTFSPSPFAVRQEEPTSVVFSSLHILRKGISVVVQ